MHGDVRVISVRRCVKIRCLDKSNRIAKSLIASRTNGIVMHRHLPVAPMRRCVITCFLDKSDRIDIETCYMFHCTQWHHRIFSEQLFQLSLTRVLQLNFSVKYFSYAETAVPKFRTIFITRAIFRYDIICPAADNKFSLRYDLSDW